LIDSTLDEALARFAGQSPLLVASDYDGTLAPIVDDPAAAVPDRDALASFRRVAAEPGVTAAIVSGRSVATLEEFVGATPAITLVGNHGSTLGHDGQSEHVRNIIRGLTNLTHRHDGAQVEAKPTGAAFHYRHAARPDLAASQAIRLAKEAGATVIEGKYVVEAILGAGNKGTAVRALAHSANAAAVLFIGDDVTDEAVFGTLGSNDISIKVGPEPTGATYRVADVRAVGSVFERLLSHLKAGPQSDL
jgi:trehalose 6-phosphate phosphatase